MSRIFLAYALSGFIALGYQVTWFRLFPDWFGSSAFSFAVVVGNFIGGLGAGALASRAVSRWIARVTGVTDAMRVYGLIELLVVLTASLTVLANHLPPHLWGSFPYHLQNDVWVQDLSYRAGQATVAIACVFAPCFFMGLTFPLLSQVFVNAPDGARFPAALYGWNTLGACAGVLSCQFLLLPLLGHSHMIGLLLGLNLALAVLFLILGRGDLPAASLSRGAVHEQLDGAVRNTPVAGCQAPHPGALLLVCGALSGLLAGALEGDMFKRISLVVSNRPGALGAAISFWAILGIFFASAFVWRAKRLRLNHIKVAFVVAGAYLYLAWRLMYPTLIARLTARYIPLSGSGMINNFPDSMAELFLFVGGCVFIPYLLISLLLPYVCNLGQRRRAHLGLVYGLNTLMFCAGLIGFTLLAPRVNVFYSLKLIWVLIAAGIALLLVLSETRRVRWWQPALALAALFAGCIAAPRGFDASYLMPNSSPTKYPISDLKSDGADTSYVVWRPDGALLYFGNTSMSGTVLPSQVYMRLMAHVPLLLQRQPTSALVICFGVGNTASAIATHAGIRHLDVVDLNRNVFDTAYEFAVSNSEVYRDPRVRLINDDGRSFLRLTRERYDLITSEPPPPMQVGVYRLYSRQYYQDVLAHLTPTGMMTQWLPVYQMPPRAAAEAIATFISVFPHTLLYSGISQEFVLLGSREPIEIDRLRQQFPTQGRVRADLANIQVDTAAKLGARIVRTDSTLRRDYLAAATISDERNDLEQLFMGTRGAAISYDPEEVLAWLRAQAPLLAASVAPIIKADERGQ